MVTLRPFRLEDLDALYAISLATGHEGGDASHLYADPRLIGHIYSAPYALLEPDLALVAVDEEGVVGFAVGTIDTASWEETLERDWWPDLRNQYDDPGAASAASTPDQKRAFMIHHPVRTPPAVVRTYPAHLHVNLLPRAQGHGAGVVLVDAWVERATKRCAGAVHVGVNGANARALKFWRRCGFETLKLGGAASRTVWMGRS